MITLRIFIIWGLVAIWGYIIFSGDQKSLDGFAPDDIVEFLYVVMFIGILGLLEFFKILDYPYYKKQSMLAKKLEEDKQAERDKLGKEKMELEVENAAKKGGAKG